MSYLPVKLDVRRKFGKAKDGSIIPFVPASADLKNRILERDDHTCQYCGFKSKKFQTVRRKDRNLPKDKISSWVTSCSFCDSCANLDQVGMQGSAILIWLPEIGQAALNHIIRAIYVAKTDDGDMADAARVALDSLMVRRYEARRRIGTDDPLILATVMLDSLTDSEFDDVTRKIDGIRLLPLDKVMMRGRDGEVDRFPEMLEFWKKSGSVFGKYDLNKWLKDLKSLSTKDVA